jgi:hypothetical protein
MHLDWRAMGSGVIIMNTKAIKYANRQIAAVCFKVCLFGREFI